MNNKKKYRIRLRGYCAILSAITLWVSCLVSLIIVIFATQLFYHGGINYSVDITLCIITCILTMIIGCVALYYSAGFFVQKIEKANYAVKKITTGDFEIRIPIIEANRKNALYLHELDELQCNINRMVSELAGMDQMCKDFISNVSHEIKTPVAAVMGITEMLKEKDLSDEERKEYLNLLYDESKRISHLSENMLRLSRLDNRSIITVHKPVRVDEQIRKCVILLAENQPFREFDIHLPVITMETDADLLQQVWINLIDNAMKYSPPDSIIHVTGESISNAYVFRIRDEGIGIPEDKQEHIFEAFYQCEESHKKDGNGLGLSIVKKILPLLYGNIECKSIEGKGTEMIVQFIKSRPF